MAFSSSSDIVETPDSFIVLRLSSSYFAQSCPSQERNADDRPSDWKWNCDDYSHYNAFGKGFTARIFGYVILNQVDSEEG
jgi:hypothetical protein